MFDILRGTIEWRLWGWNLATVTFWFTVLFTLIDAWGYKKQGETIWAHRKAESVSAITFVYGACLCYSYTIYAVYVGSVAVFFNGLVLGYSIFPIIRGIFKFKRLSRKEKLCCLLFAFMAPAMLFLPWKETMFFFFMFGAVISLAMQPWEMWRNKNAGDVDIRAMSVFFLGVFFWASYGFAVGNLTLQIINSIAFLLFGIIIALWFKYRQKTRKENRDDRKNYWRSRAERG